MSRTVLYVVRSCNVVVFAGQGDARRAMSLLWREAGAEEPRPGPKPALRVDAVLAEARHTYDLGGGWRTALVAWAEDLWEFYLRHPWVLQVSQARPVLGPNEYVVLDTVLRIMFETGLEPPAVRRLTGALFQFVRAIAQVVAEARVAAAATGTSDEQWWYARSALLMELAPDFHTRFPMVTKLAKADGFTLADETVPYQEQASTETFHAGLKALLDGIEASASRKP